MPEILLCGAEGEQFLFQNTLTTDGADDKRRGSVKLTAGQRLLRVFDNTYADFWVHFRMAPKALLSNSGTTGKLVEIKNGTNTLVTVTATPTQTSNTVSFRFDVSTDNGGSFNLGASMSQALNEYMTYDIRVQTTGTTRTVTFYRNEVLFHKYVATGTGFLLPNTVSFAPRKDAAVEDDTRYQDIIVTDALPTVGMELATLVPSAVGTYSEFTNDYTAIDDEGYDQSSVISTTVVGQRESWFFSDPEFNIGDKVIYGVAITSVAQLDLAGVIGDFQPFVRIGGIDYSGTSLGANNVAPNAYTTIFKQNPSTAAPWSQAELVGLESGVLSV